MVGEIQLGVLPSALLSWHQQPQSGWHGGARWVHARCGDRARAGQLAPAPTRSVKRLGWLPVLSNTAYVLANLTHLLLCRVTAVVDRALVAVAGSRLEFCHLAVEIVTEGFYSCFNFRSNRIESFISERVAKC